MTEDKNAIDSNEEQNPHLVDAAQQETTATPQELVEYIQSNEENWSKKPELMEVEYTFQKPNRVPHDTESHAWNTWLLDKIETLKQAVSKLAPEGYIVEGKGEPFAKAGVRGPKARSVRFNVRKVGSQRCDVNLHYTFRFIPAKPASISARFNNANA